MVPVVVFLRYVGGGYAGFWLVAGTLTTLGIVDLGLSQGAQVLGLLMLGNGAALASAAVCALRGYRLVDYMALVLFMANALLSIIDDAGPLDYGAFVVSGVLFILLLVGLRFEESKRSRPEMGADPPDA